MRITVFLSCLSGLMMSSLADASFLRDVVQQKAALPFQHEENVEDLLLEKAIPIAEYEEQLKKLGLERLSVTERKLEENDDDYFSYNQDLYSFSGYSLKYSKCQPVQRFSEEAIQSGEYSPMITDDIVILRLCPTQSCYSSEQYGCHYNYAEYAIGVKEFIKIMLRHEKDRRGRLCQWCANCGYGYQYNNRNLEDGGNDDGGKQGDDGWNENDAYDGYNYNDNGGNNDNDDGSNACKTYGSYCSNYYSDCVYYDPNGNNNAKNYVDDQYQKAYYLDLDDYVDYVNCAEFADKWGEIYFTRPMCDSSDNSLKMGIFYDGYCTNYAGDDISEDSFNIAFNDTAFAFVYEGSCMDCTSSNYPPNFVANSYMCNKIRQGGAQCTTNMVYNLFEGSSYDATECSFIESIRFGTYNSNGEITVRAGDEQPETVTDLQKIGLIGTGLICFFFITYACYIHHAMTNLLIKSLSHRELLPPSRHTKRRIPPQRKTPRGGKKSSRLSASEDDDDWDRSVRVS